MYVELMYIIYVFFLTLTFLNNTNVLSSISVKTVSFVLIYLPFYKGNYISCLTALCAINANMNLHITHNITFLIIDATTYDSIHLSLYFLLLH